MQNADLIVTGEYIVPIEGAVFTEGAVVVGGGRILDIGPFAGISEKYKADRIIGGQGRAVMPGLINTHTHAAMVFLRGIADDLPLRDWLEKHIWPKEEKWLGPDFISDAVELACLEMLKSGVTAYNDMYFFEDVAAPVAKKMGIRAVLGAGILDFPTRVASTIDEYFLKAERFIKDWREDEMITPSVAPHALYTCGPESMKRAGGLAEKYGVPMHMHLSETRWEVEEVKKKYGKAPVMFLDGLGVLNGNVIAAHCVWVTDEEIEVLAGRDVGVSHCIESNLKLASGIAPVTRMLKAGLKVSFGTDGAASNNDLDVLSEMATAAKLHKAASGDPSALDAETVLKMATVWGAYALGYREAGSLVKGKKADMIVINLQKPHLTPIYNISSHLVYSAKASDVETVIVNGNVVVEAGRLLTADEAEILEKARWWGERIKKES